MFTPAAPEPEKLELTLGKIRGLVGEKNVGYPELFDTHRPGVGSTDGSFCCHFDISVRRSKRESRQNVCGRACFRARSCKSPDRGDRAAIGGDPDQWNRDEYDLALSDGALYRLYLDRAPKKWFVEGVYD